MDFQKQASDIWAEFDELMEIEKICDVNLTDHVNLVRKVSVACIQQIVNEYHILKYKVKDQEKEIDVRYEFWTNIYHELLKL